MHVCIYNYIKAAIPAANIKGVIIMYAQIHGTGKPVKLGPFSFTAFSAGQWEEMDGSTSENPAIWSDVSAIVEKHGKQVGYFDCMGMAYDRNGFDVCAIDARLVGLEGEEISDAEMFGDLLPGVLNALLSAVSLLGHEIEPKCSALIDEIEAERPLKLQY